MYTILPNMKRKNGLEIWLQNYTSSNIHNITKYEKYSKDKRKIRENCSGPNVHAQNKSYMLIFFIYEYINTSATLTLLTKFWHIIIILGILNEVNNKMRLYVNIISFLIMGVTFWKLSRLSARLHNSRRLFSIWIMLYMHAIRFWSHV